MKKGISPIVATTLLVTFVIAMGIIVSVWMRTTVSSYVAEGEKGVELEITCMNTKLHLEQKDISTIYIKNNGNIPFSGYIAVLYDANDNANVFRHPESAIPAYGILEYPEDEVENLAGKTKIKIIPRVITDGGIESECTDNGITLTL